MRNSITLTIPSDFDHFKLVKSTAKKIVRNIFRDKEDTKALLQALKELVENAILHGYEGSSGYIAVTFHPFEYGIRVDVRDWGLPMSSTKHKSVPIKQKADEGFNRIYNLTDRFEYINLGREGKQFYIIKYASDALIPQTEPLPSGFMIEQEDDEPVKGVSSAAETTVTVRPFREGDEEAIANLIYKNYGHSYIKDAFYFPRKILQYEGSRIVSVVAQAADEVIGHFALLRSDDSNIAEVGIAVVDPRFKGRGIMNSMFDAIITQAQETGLDALFAEAIMYHPFSQKSNLSHRFIETSLQIGKIPGEVRLRENDINAQGERGPVLIGFKLFKPREKSLCLPRQYREFILQTYAQAEDITLDIREPGETGNRYTQLSYVFEPVLNVATIVINHYGDDFAHKFHIMLNHLQAKQCDMIYADINLETVEAVDKVVAILNRALFFYSGVHFLKHKNMDYLQLQYKHSHAVGRKNLICYSEFCDLLHAYVLQDEKRVRSFPADG